MKRLLIFILPVVVCLSAFHVERTIDQDEGKGKAVQVHPFEALGIPKGHLPSPGECKIWIPGRPAGQQGPSQSCKSAMRKAPLGGWIITHTGKMYKVNVLSDKRSQVIVEVRFYALP